MGGPAAENLPEVKATSELKIREFTLKANVLSDGRRVIEKKGFDKFLDYIARGGPITPEEEKKVDTFVQGFGI